MGMISTAHVGVGIFGTEGRQAARASDFAIGRFSFLKKLLLVHGREFYRKNSLVVFYNYLKNITLVVPQFFFGFDSLFSGNTFYEQVIFQMFNIFFTSLPIIIFGIFDREHTDEELLDNPRRYVKGIKNRLFSTNRFAKWVLFGIIQSALLYYATFYLLQGSINENGETFDLSSKGRYINRYYLFLPRYFTCNLQNYFRNFLAQHSFCLFLDY